MRRLECFLVGITLIAMSATAQPTKITCPWTMKVTQTAEDIPQGWRIGRADAPIRLQEISMTLADGGDTMSDYEKKLSGERVEYTWDLNALAKKEPWFVRCEYTRTNVLLLIPVPATMKFCSTIQKDGFDRKIQNFMTCE